MNGNIQRKPRLASDNLIRSGQQSYKVHNEQLYNRQTWKGILLTFGKWPSPQTELSPCPLVCKLLSGTQEVSFWAALNKKRIVSNTTRNTHIHTPQSSWCNFLFSLQKALGPCVTENTSDILLVRTIRKRSNAALKYWDLTEIIWSPVSWQAECQVQWTWLGGPLSST